MRIHAKTSFELDGLEAEELGNAVVTALGYGYQVQIRNDANGPVLYFDPAAARDSFDELAIRVRIEASIRGMTPSRVLDSILESDHLRSPDEVEPQLTYPDDEPPEV